MVFICLWTIAVITSFATAGFLIKDSFASWRSSPVVTSLSTHPIEYVDLPETKVCPPKGSNTLLNYAIHKSDTLVLNDSVRQELIEVATDSGVEVFYS